MDFIVFYVQEHPNAQPAVVLVLKHFRRQGHGFKSHPTDLESQESNSGLLGTRRVTYPLHHGGSDAYCFLLSSFPANLSLTYQILMKQSESI